jgi:hypothetical protein
MQFDKMRRREFVTLLSGAAAWPLAARAQPAVPVIGIMHSTADTESRRARILPLFTAASPKWVTPTVEI